MYRAGQRGTEPAQFRYSALALAWIPPELREGGDEIARAGAGTLPRLVERGDLHGVAHCHSVYSDGTNTLVELAEACRALGYAWVGITDHSVAAAYAGGLSPARVAQQHAEIDAWNGASPGLRILKGIEADILADGRLDYGPDLLDRFDFVIGSVHSRFELDVEAMTARILRAMDDPHLTILGHPTGRLLLTRDPYPASLKSFVRKEAAQYLAQPNVTSIGVGFKITNNQPTQEMCIQFTVGRKVAIEALQALAAIELPKSFVIDGFTVPTDVVQRSYETSAREIRIEAKLQNAAPRKSVINPIVPGVSIGHPSISAGTAGCVVYDAINGTCLCSFQLACIEWAVWSGWR